MATSVKPMMQTDRTKALTDGVLAIVLTILVLSFEVPDQRFGRDALWHFFHELARPFVAYIVSFGLVAAYWVQHVAIFHYVRVGNRIFTWLNILFLLPLTLLPFLTDLRATYHDEYVTTFMYAAANIFAGVLMLTMWEYARRRGLSIAVSAEVDRSMRRRILLGIVINVAGAAVAPIDVYLSSAVFLLLPTLYVSHRIVDSHWNDPTGTTEEDRGATA
jgi:uncharacterized membrane protein